MAAQPSDWASWIALATEYGEIFYCWTDFSPTDARASFAAGDTPREFIDGLASEFGLDSYADLNFGNTPPNFDRARYDHP